MKRWPCYRQSTQFHLHQDDPAGVYVRVPVPSVYQYSAVDLYNPPPVPCYKEVLRQVAQFEHGPERPSERPPHTQHVDLHSEYPNEVFLNGPTNRKEVALTFDDGPDNIWTPRILEILSEYKVKAEFNCVGEQVERYPKMVERIFRLGHNVGNHSWSHANFTKISVDAVKNQVQRTNNLITNLLGVKPRFFRPPYGAMNRQVIETVMSLDMKILYWNVDSLDWSGLSQPQVTANVLGHVRPGSIILMHFAGGVGGNLSATIESLPIIVRTLRKEGYAFKRVSDLLSLPAYR